MQSPASQFQKPVLHNCFPYLNVPEKRLSDHHGAAHIKVFLPTHWINVPDHPKYAVLTDKDSLPPEAYEYHGWILIIIHQAFVICL